MTTGPKRTKEQRIHDRREIAERLLRGESQMAIAEALGVAESQITYDKKKLLAEWRAAALMDTNEAVGVELAKLNEIETQAWRAYFRSCESRTVTTDEDLPEAAAKPKRPKTVDPFEAAKMMDAILDDVYEADDDVPDILKAPGTQIWISRKSTRIEQRDGNPQFLMVAMNCIEKRCKLLGLNAPEKHQHTGRDGGPIEILGIEIARSAGGA